MLFPGKCRRLEAPSDEKRTAASSFMSPKRAYDMQVLYKCQLQLTYMRSTNLLHLHNKYCERLTLALCSSIALPCHRLRVALSSGTRESSFGVKASS